MQKKLIALAVAGLVAAPAFAQSNVTIYGIVDIGMANYGDSANDASSRTGLDSGMQSGSRLGFRGTEDLGNGLKASFVLENSIGVDTGAGPNMTRQSFAALSGGFGTVALGRQYTPQFNMMGAIDPFGVGTVGDALNGRGVYVAGAALAPTLIRLDNLIAYVSPDFSGFNVTAGYTFDAVGNETGQDGDIRVWAINPVYKNGPIYAAINYHQVKVKGATDSNKVFDIGGTYDLGMAKLAAVYGTNKLEGVADVRQWLIGASAPVSEAGAVMVSYAQSKDKVDGGDAKGTKWALGYTHSLSKRTNLYAAYADISNKNGAMFTVTGGDANYQRGLNVGLRHRF